MPPDTSVASLPVHAARVGRFFQPRSGAGKAWSGALGLLPTDIKANRQTAWFGHRCAEGNSRAIGLLSRDPRSPDVRGSATDSGLLSAAGVALPI